MNGYELNTGSTVAALLYGRGDLVETLRTAYNFGWDADNTAATAGTIVGTMKGYRWCMAQGWNIVDRYRNTTRDNMPMNETITSFADRLIDLAEWLIVEGGGKRMPGKGRPTYRIVLEHPANVYPLIKAEQQKEQMRKTMGDNIIASLLGEKSKVERARAAYLAICLDMEEAFRADKPAEWNQAIEALNSHWKVMQNIYYQPDIPLGKQLRAKATRAGLSKPAEKRPVW
jgi:hypothetical protein